MSCQILSDGDQRHAVLYCSTSDWAFGPVFYRDDDHDADVRAEAFLRWLQSDACPYFTFEQDHSLGREGRDARRLTEAGLGSAYSAWLTQEPAQWAREEEAVQA